jgi:hypothetical protein
MERGRVIHGLFLIFMDIVLLCYSLENTHGLKQIILV